MEWSEGGVVCARVGNSRVKRSCTTGGEEILSMIAIHVKQVCAGELRGSRSN